MRKLLSWIIIAAFVFSPSQSFAVLPESSQSTVIPESPSDSDLQKAMELKTELLNSPPQAPVLVFNVPADPYNTSTFRFSVDVAQKKVFYEITPGQIIEGLINSKTNTAVLELFASADASVKLTLKFKTSNTGALILRSAGTQLSQTGQPTYNLSHSYSDAGDYIGFGVSQSDSNLNFQNFNLSKTSAGTWTAFGVSGDIAAKKYTVWNASINAADIKDYFELSIPKKFELLDNQSQTKTIIDWGNSLPSLIQYEKEDSQWVARHKIVSTGQDYQSYIIDNGTEKLFIQNQSVDGLPGFTAAYNSIQNNGAPSIGLTLYSPAKTYNVHYPKTDVLVIDGKKYQIVLSADGKLHLKEHFYDLNDDKVLDDADMELLAAQIKTGVFDSKFDFNSDGKLDDKDFEVLTDKFIEELKKTAIVFVVNPGESIALAQEQARLVLAAGLQRDIHVLIKSGDYYNTHLTFDERDSGQNGFKVTYRGMPGQELPRLIGGVALPQTMSPTTWTRDNSLPGNVYKINVAQYALNEDSIAGLFVDGVAAVNADSEKGRTTKVTDMPDTNLIPQYFPDTTRMVVGDGTGKASKLGTYLKDPTTASGYNNSPSWEEVYPIDISYVKKDPSSNADNNWKTVISYYSNDKSTLISRTERDGRSDRLAVIDEYKATKNMKAIELYSFQAFKFNESYRYHVDEFSGGQTISGLYAEMKPLLVAMGLFNANNNITDDVRVVILNQALAKDNLRSFLSDSQKQVVLPAALQTLLNNLNSSSGTDAITKANRQLIETLYALKSPNSAFKPGNLPLDFDVKNSKVHYWCSGTSLQEIRIKAIVWDSPEHTSGTIILEDVFAHAIIKKLQPDGSYLTTLTGRELLPIVQPNGVQVVKAGEWITGHEFNIINSKSMLSEGEFYYDGAGRLYYSVPSGKSISDLKIVLPTQRNIIKVEGKSADGVVSPVHDVVFDRLDLSTTQVLNQLKDMVNGVTEEYGATTPRDMAAVYIHNAQDIVFKNSKIHDTGTAGISMYGHAQNVQIMNNEIAFIGSDGIVINGDSLRKMNSSADLPDYLSHHNQIVSNHIHDVGLRYEESSGIYLVQTGDNLISNNKIDHISYNAILMLGLNDSVAAKRGLDKKTRDRLTWNYTKNNKIIGNDISHVTLKMDDGGGIYAIEVGKSNEIAGNKFHDIYSGVRPEGGNISSMAIYLDCGQASYFDIHDNIFYNFKSSTGMPMSINGSFNVVRNNTFITDNTFYPVQFQELVGNEGNVLENNIFINNNPLNKRGVKVRFYYQTRVPTTETAAVPQNAFKVREYNLKTLTYEWYLYFYSKQLASSDNNVFYNASGIYNFEANSYDIYSSPTTIFQKGQTMSFSDWQTIPVKGMTQTFDAHSVLATTKPVLNADFSVPIDSPYYGKGARVI